MRDYQQPILARQSHGDEPFLFHRVIWIWNSDAELVSEYRRRFFKGHGMLLTVSCSLVWIPLKIDAHGDFSQVQTCQMSQVLTWYLSQVCPQGTSNAHHVATLAGLKTCR